VWHGQAELDRGDLAYIGIISEGLRPRAVAQAGCLRYPCPLHDCRGSGGLMLFFGDDDHGHPATEHYRSSFDLAQFGQYFGNLIHNLAATIDMHHLTPAEEHGKLYFMPLFQKLHSPIDLDVPIMIVNFRTQTNLFQDNRMLLFLAQLCFSLLFVQVFSIIHNPADRRLGVRGDFDKIQPQIMGFELGILDIDQPHLIVVFIDQPDRAGSNPLIDA